VRYPDSLSARGRPNAGSFLSIEPSQKSYHKFPTVKGLSQAESRIFYSEMIMGCNSKEVARNRLGAGANVSESNAPLGLAIYD
jgi:hypothetical protein